MGTDVQVAVIGGGAVGASVLYWLTRLGWTDVMLLERRELTSGSTWHAAGNTTYFGPYPSMSRLFAGSIRTYLAAQDESGHDIGFHQTGSLRLAASPRERHFMEGYQANFDALNIPYRIVENNDVAALHPLIDTTHTFGAAHTPTDGHVDPSGVTHAMAKAARARGAVVERWRPAERIEPKGDHWRIETGKGAISAQHVVMAASFWTRELLEPLGYDLPLYTTLHHEMITEDAPELAALDHEVPAMRDSYVSCSVRPEAKGLLIGIYESEPEFWALDGIPKDFAEDLFPADLDRLMPHLERLMERMPRFGDLGLKKIVHGAMCFTPDGLPLIGPAAGHPGLWLASGFNVGIGTGGGAGEVLARWMVEGQAPTDLPGIYADRFGMGMAMDDALNAIRHVYARGYTLPDHI